MVSEGLRVMSRGDDFYLKPGGDQDEEAEPERHCEEEEGHCSYPIPF